MLCLEQKWSSFHYQLKCRICSFVLSVIISVLFLRIQMISRSNYSLTEVTSMRANGLVQTSVFSEKRKLEDSLVRAYFKNNAMSSDTDQFPFWRKRFIPPELIAALLERNGYSTQWIVSFQVAVLATQHISNGKHKIHCLISLRLIHLKPPNSHCCLH